MKIQCSLIITVFLLIACSKNAQRTPFSEKVQIIEKINGIEEWQLSFDYDDQDNIIQIEDSRNEGSIFNLIYENEQLTRIDEFDLISNALLYQDSIHYNLNGQISKIEKYTIDSPNEDPIDWIFSYNDENKIEQLEWNGSIVKFFWTGLNIVKTEHYYPDGTLAYDFVYQYDDKTNYVKELYNPFFYNGFDLSKPNYWTKNNVVSWDFTNYVGPEFEDCEDCLKDGSMEYIYNDNDYPTFHESGLRKTRIIYF